MPELDVPLKRLSFGKTTRTDTWWAFPALPWSCSARSSSTRRGRRFRATTTRFGPYLSPFYSPLLFGDDRHAWFGAKPAWMPGVAAVHRGAADPAGRPAASASPATTTAAPTTRRSGPIRPAAPSASRARRICGERSFPLSFRTSIATSVPRAIFIVILSCDVWKALWLAGADGATHFGIGVGTLVLTGQRRSCSAATRFGCHSLRHLVGGWQGQALRRAGAQGRYDCVSWLNRATCCWRGAACSRSVFADLYIRLCSMGVIWTTGESSDARLSRRIEYDVLVIGAGGAGLRAAIEASAAGRHGRAGLQIAPRQGAHRHGRRRHGRGAGQRRRSRQLEGPLRRHHARRPVREQLAHGRAARQGSARSRARAGSLGRGLRSHQGRPHPAAQLRRPPLSASRARRRSHRPRDDPHAAGSRHPSGHRRPHGVHRSSSLLKDGDRVVGAFGYEREHGRFHVFQRQGGRARHRRHRPRLQDHQQQLGSTPATGTRSRTTRAPS